MRAFRPLLIALPLLAAVALPRPAAAQDEDRDEGNWVTRCQSWNRDSRRVNFCEERVVRMAAPRKLSVDGRENGGVSVRGWDGADVQVRQRIQAWAESDAAARQVAQAVRVHTAGGEIYADGPDNSRGSGFAVSYVVYVPRNLDLRVETRNGPVSVKGVSGEMELSAQNGPISLDRVGGDVRARAQNGPLTVRLAGTRWSGEGLDAETTNGPVTLSVPRDYSATLTTGTVNGPMNIGIPVTVQGRFPRQFTTQLGSGGAPIRIVTTNGPVQVQRL
jgi:DUF4097 and DUF4098 domain-containing protein YvlB